MTAQKRSGGWVVWVGVGCVGLGVLGVVVGAVLVLGAGAWTARRVHNEALVGQLEEERAAALRAQTAERLRAQTAERQRALERTSARRETLDDIADEREGAELDAIEAAPGGDDLRVGDAGVGARSRVRSGADPLDGLDAL